MTLYVLDTDHVTLHQHGHPQIIARICAHIPRNVMVTVITFEEQMRGRLAQIGRPGVDLTAAYEQLLATADYFCRFTVLSFDAEAN